MAEDEEVPMEQDNASMGTTIGSSGVPEYEPIVVPPGPEEAGLFDKTGPRLMITHIVNENFKSYAGIKTLGPFHKSFSAIVGPNGSGKSNVIDSMLFVFGYRANKIRSKKISVLIHNSEHHKNITSCSVAVHFQKIIDTGEGDEDFDVVPNSKFVVKRTASKDNSSFYQLNGKRLQYKEVAVLLRQQGIDLDHNRFLILQGEVEQIAMMKPKAATEHDEGMLEFLEDIIGSSRFKEPIELLTKRVEDLNEMRGEKLNRVKAVEKEKNDLEGSKDEAIEYLSMENDIVKKQNKLYQKYINECAINEEKATKKRDEIKDGMKEVTDKLEEINTNKKEKIKEQKKVHKRFDALTKNVDETKEQFSEFEQQDVKCREDLKHSKNKTKKLEKTLEQEKKKLEELKLVPSESEKVIENFKKKESLLEKEKAKEEETLKKVMDSLKTETEGLQKQKDAKEKELLEMQQELSEKKSKMDVAQSELDLYLKNQQTADMKLRETVRNLEKASSTLKERKSAIQELERRIPDNQNALLKAKKDLKEAAALEEQLSSKVKQNRLKVEEARSAMASSKSKGRVLESLMAQKKNGRIPGIYGRLGDLGAIDDKYDVAISTACGALDNIVVDSINTAQKCVEYLKRENIGSATFIGLDKMQRWVEHTRRKINTPESVPRLFDLVKVKDDTILPAFYFALRDTLVANNLDQATRVAYGKTRYRVVTLEGQLIDQSGTMSGGGGRVSRGRMCSSVVGTMSGGGGRVSRGRMCSSVVGEEMNPKELENMERMLEQEQQEAQHCRDNKAKLEDTVDKLERSTRDLKHSLNKFNMEIKSLIEQEISLENQKKECEERVKAAAPDKKELEKLKETVAGYRKDYEKVHSIAAEIESQVHKFHKEIMDIGGAKLAAVQSRVDTIGNQIDQVVGQITKANVAIKTSERNTKKSEKKVEDVQQEITENLEHISQLEVQFKQLEVDATKVLEAYQQAQTEMREVEEVVGEINQQIAQLEEEENNLKKDNIEIKHELEKYETIVKDNTMKVKHWKKERGKLSLHQIDQMEMEELPTLPIEELSEINKEDTQYEITVLEEKLAQMKPNMAAIEEYRKKEEMYLKRVSELDKITEIRDNQRKNHEDMRKTRLDEFMAGFSIITNKLKEMYQMITLGGDAELELVDSLDPFSEGIVFSVRPPKKSWKNISNLSGGEKTLSSLALVFALHHYKPTPLYVMDEIDAALDFKNVSIVANYIKERTKNAQFIIISLRNNMFELADRLIGIYKTDNATKSVTINPKKMSIPLQDSTNAQSAPGPVTA
ncbi:unnamed protein product [Owenia fusiformis]|uniref:Structural maintenance of chromosomes protein n=1 Tax=Owenia fusiformis TaxID=6347 RepID=A0A8J1UZQ1_OWEFU|nr:unnamed protein product [Owenia fusiformis]